MELMVYTHENLEPIFKLLEKTKGVTQSEQHHPEGDVFNHSLQVLYLALRETTDIDLIFAAMLHDVGKIEMRSGHEEASIRLSLPYCSLKTLWLIEHHMRIWTFILGEMKKYSKVQYLVNHPWLPELILLARWDKKGRVPRKVVYDRDKILDKINIIVYNKYRG